MNEANAVGRPSHANIIREKAFTLANQLPSGDIPITFKIDVQIPISYQITEKTRILLSSLFCIIIIFICENDGVMTHACFDYDKDNQKLSELRNIFSSPCRFLGKLVGNIIALIIIYLKQRKYYFIFSMLLFVIFTSILFFHSNSLMVLFGYFLSNMGFSFIEIYAFLWTGQFGLEHNRGLIVALLDASIPLGTSIGIALCYFVGSNSVKYFYLFLVVIMSTCRINSSFFFIYYDVFY